MPKLLYIMGRGHSGSTVLDGLLGNAPGAVGVGELVVGMTRYDERCSCGDSIEGCGYWRDVRRRFEAASDVSWHEGATTLRDAAHIGRLPMTLLAPARSVRLQRLRRLNDEIVAAIAAAADAALVVDSSKEFTRGLFLARTEPGAVIVHLVRSPHDVLASLEERLRAGKGFSFLRRRFESGALAPLFMLLAAGGWLVGNLLGELVRHIAGERAIRVRYEDLCAAPGEVLRRIAAVGELDVEGVVGAVAREERLSLGHKSAGNRILRSGEFVFRPPGAGVRTLSWPYAVMASVVTLPLLAAYGYTLSGRARAG